MDERILLPATADRPVSTARGEDLAATDSAKMAVRLVAAADECDSITTTQSRPGIEHGHLESGTGRALGLSNTSPTRVLQE